jgi:probable addiction module antidote protein
MKKSKPYTDFLFERLKNPEEAADYLNAALEDKDPGVFLMALRDIAKANGGITHVTQEAHLNRETLYRTLSKKGNPTLVNLRTLLDICGLHLSIKPGY